MDGRPKATQAAAPQPNAEADRDAKFEAAIMSFTEWLAAFASGEGHVIVEPRATGGFVIRLGNVANGPDGV